MNDLPEREYYLGEGGIEPIPVLVLAMPGEWIRDDELVLRGGRDWFRYEQRCGGVARHRFALAAAIELEPRTPEILEGMWRILDEYHGTNLCRPATVDDLVRYRYLLRKHLRADCNRDYETLEEAVYPVDLDHLPNLAGEAIPEDVNELVRWKYERFAPTPRVGLWILGPNSD